jgi:hypothetical protein
MRLDSRLTIGLAALLFLVFGSPLVRAATVTTTYSGTLANQAQVLEETFTVASSSTVTMFTTSYGGGANLNSTTASAGGFQPMITLNNSAGNYVFGEAITSPIATKDPTTGLTLDAYLLDSHVAAGSYIAVLTDWLNQQPATATNLSSGFVDLGSGGSTYVDEMFNSRNSSYALNISIASNASAAPEPATFWLVIPALGCAILLASRKRRASAV